MVGKRDLRKDLCSHLIVLPSCERVLRMLFKPRKPQVPVPQEGCYGEVRQVVGTPSTEVALVFEVLGGPGRRWVSRTSQ